MRFIKYLILAAIVVVLVSLALANRTPVTLRLMPDEIAGTLDYPDNLNQITLSLWVVILVGIVIGWMLGQFLEFLREHKFRAEARRGRRETKRMASEITTLKKEKAKGDDVLALLDDTGSGR